jgi:hypothetical protein
MPSFGTSMLGTLFPAHQFIIYFLLRIINLKKLKMTLRNSESLHQIDLLKYKLVDALKDKDDACTDLLKLDQAHRKLAKENKELLKKHELFCTEMKIVKSEKEQLSRENNSLSVVLKASKKGLKENLKTFEKEKKGLQIELMNLNKFKVEKEAEQKKIKRAEKKSRQRVK